MFYRWLRQLVRAVEIMIETHISEAGLTITPLQLMVLGMLCKQNGQRPMDLAAAVGYNATSFTPIIDSLMIGDTPWIEKRANINDRRSVLLYLTPYAFEQRDQILAVYAVAEKGMAAQIDTFISRLPVLAPDSTEADTVAVL